METLADRFNLLSARQAHRGEIALRCGFESLARAMGRPGGLMHGLAEFFRSHRAVGEIVNVRLPRAQHLAPSSVRVLLGSHETSLPLGPSGTAIQPFSTNGPPLPTGSCLGASCKCRYADLLLMR